MQAEHLTVSKQKAHVEVI